MRRSRYGYVREHAGCSCTKVGGSFALLRSNRDATMGTRVFSVGAHMVPECVHSDLYRTTRGRKQRRRIPRVVR